MVAAETGECRPGAADDLPDVLAAAVDKDGLARRLLRQQYVEPGAASDSFATACLAARREPLEILSRVDAEGR
jgi:hypothetical protein